MTALVDHAACRTAASLGDHRCRHPRFVPTRFDLPRLSLHQLEGDRYRPVARSRFLPDLDVEQLVSFVQPGNQTEAVRTYREALGR